MKIIFNASKAVQGFRKENSFEFATPTEEPSNGTDIVTNGIVFKDIAYQKIETSGAVNNYKINITQTVGLPPPIFETTTPSIISVDSDGHVKMIAPGVGKVKVKTPNSGARMTERSMGASTFSTAYKHELPFAAGSIGEHLVQQIALLTAGKTPGSAIQTFYTSNSNDVTAPEMTINSSLFAKTLDWSCIAIHRENAIIYKPTLVSPRHVIMAAHVGLPDGEKISFKKPDGTYQTASIVRSESLLTLNNVNQDFVIGYLDAVITGITPVQTMPKDWELSYAPGASRFEETGLTINAFGRPIYGMSGMPSIRLAWHDENGNNVHELGYIKINNVRMYKPPVSNVIPSEPAGLGIQIQHDATNWGSLAHAGDSGSPSFFVINGKLILIGVLWTDIGYGNISAATTELNTMMNNTADVSDPVKGSYALNHPDISAFATYV